MAKIPEYDPKELPSYFDILDRDSGNVPEVLYAASPPECADSSTGLAVGRYRDQSFHDLEVEKVWRRTWQFACFEEDIPNVGDYTLYEIAGICIIVTRSGQQEFSAFYNACRHRGAALVDKSGSRKRFVCPYHGWTYDLRGNLVDVPAKWDFPHVCENEKIKSVRVASFMGILFVNMDEDAIPLEDYISPLQDYMGLYPPYKGRRQRTAWIRKVVPVNWKHAQEAFYEGYHVAVTHPELSPFSSNYEMRVNELSKHVSVSHPTTGTPSTRTGPDVSEHQLLNNVRKMLGLPEMDLEPGQTARSVLAEEARKMYKVTMGLDLSAASDFEVVDSPLYYVFPNCVIWGGYAIPWIYRFRPNGSDPNSAIMEVIQMTVVPEGATPQHVPMKALGGDEPFSSAPELDYLGPVLDQDLNNMKKQEIGMRSTPESEFFLSKYMESLVRRYHALIDDYIND